MHTIEIDKYIILIFTANPIDTNRINVDVETKEILYSITDAKFSSNFHVVHIPAVTIEDITKNMQKYRPSIIHFACHGTETRRIIIENQERKSIELKHSELFELLNLSEYKKNLKLLVMNTNYFSINKFKDTIPFIIYSDVGLSDTIAFTFSKNFYSYIANGFSIHSAYKVSTSKLYLQENPYQLYMKSETVDFSFINLKTLNEKLSSSNLPKQLQKKDIRKIITDMYNENEFEILCADLSEDIELDKDIKLNLSIDTLGGETYDNKVKNLIEKLERKDLLDYLIEHINR